MRLWSLHPQYLDPQGLVALWREGLLAQKVLRGLTKGYRHHPQLHRFQVTSDSVLSISFYLWKVAKEAQNRQYRFDARKIVKKDSGEKYNIGRVTRGQLDYEFNHLKMKLLTRNPQWLQKLEKIDRPKAHPCFRVIQGEIESWERPPL